jgi:uncharacterized protein YcbX
VNVGTVSQIRSYPVKSMLGESLGRAAIDASGILGDRAHALFDRGSGKVASAKDPRKWAQLLGFRAVYTGPPSLATLTVTLPDGTEVRGNDDDVDAVLSAAAGRPVHLGSDSSDAGYDYVWEVEGIAPDDVIAQSQTSTTDDGRPVSTMPLAFMAPGTFQDVAPITIITTSALRAMAQLHPDGDWSPDRFRMNLLVETDSVGVPENDWPGRRLCIGSAELEVAALAPRCVMTTLAQTGLPRDRGVLQTIARHNMQEFAGLGRWACLGAYATVVRPGEIALGDALLIT